MRILALISILYLLLGCSSHNSPHKYEDEKLRAIMGDMNNLLFNGIYSSLEQDIKMQRYSQKMSFSIERISKDIKYLSKIKPDIEREQEFLNFSNQLLKEAEKLRAISKSGDLKSLKPTVDRVLNICNSCHREFRD